MEDKRIRNLFIARACLWVVAFVATAYWIWYDFSLYHQGIVDVYEHAALLRPVFWGGVAVAVASICISFYLRSISDKIKKEKKHAEGNA